jgi:excisionase family DNA binding protein
VQGNVKGVSGEDEGMMSESVVTPVVYRVEEAAEALRVSRSVIYELIRSGQLRTVKVGRRRLVPVTALDECVAMLGGDAA